MIFSNSTKEHQPVKRWHIIVFVLIMVAAVGVKIYTAIWPKAYLNIGGERLKVLVANTEARGIEGWSNKKDMGNYQGMLFIFPERGQHAMVMRAMRFPLDIVWLDGTTVVDIAPNLPPDQARLEAELTPYFARAASNFVVELPAGFAKDHNLKVGDSIKIER